MVSVLESDVLGRVESPRVDRGSTLPRIGGGLPAAPRLADQLSSQGSQLIPAMIGRIQLLFQGPQPVAGRLYFRQIAARVELR